MVKLGAPFGIELMAERLKAERQQTIFESRLAREEHGYRASPRKKPILTTTRNRYEVRLH